MEYTLKQNDWRQLAYDVARSAGGELINYMTDDIATIIVDVTVDNESVVYTLDYPDVSAWLETQLIPVLTERHKSYY